MFILTDFTYFTYILFHKKGAKKKEGKKDHLMASIVTPIIFYWMPCCISNKL